MADKSYLPLMPPALSLWKHYKGTTFKILGSGVMEKTGEPAIFYQENGNILSAIWVRTLSEWSEQVDDEVSRFTRVDTPDEPNPIKPLDTTAHAA